jgi:hypothetical protein
MSIANVNRSIASDYTILSIIIPVNDAAVTLRSLIAAADTALDLTRVMGIRIDDASADWIYGKTAVDTAGRTVDVSEDPVWDLPIGSPGILDTYVQAVAAGTVTVKALIYLGSKEG